MTQQTENGEIAEFDDGKHRHERVRVEWEANNGTGEQSLTGFIVQPPEGIKKKSKNAIYVSDDSQNRYFEISKEPPHSVRSTRGKSSFVRCGKANQITLISDTSPTSELEQQFREIESNPELSDEEKSYWKDYVEDQFRESFEYNSFQTSQGGYGIAYEVRLQCNKCNYTWDSKARGPRVTCPDCGQKMQPEIVGQTSTLVLTAGSTDSSLYKFINYLGEQKELLEVMADEGWEIEKVNSEGVHLFKPNDGSMTRYPM